MSNAAGKEKVKKKKIGRCLNYKLCKLLLVGDVEHFAF